MKRLLSFMLTLALATPVLATHNHPSKAKQLKISFVSAYNQCTAPNETHRPSLALPSCAPPLLSTDNNPTNRITFGPTGALTAKLKVGNGDIKAKVKGIDIQNNGVPFTGTLHLSALLRWADHGCGVSLSTPCTMVDFPFPIDVTCTVGVCTANTSFNAVITAAVHSGDETNVEVGQMTIYDPDFDPAFRQGLFVP